MSEDHKPRVITVVIMFITMTLVVPIIDIFTGRKKDFDDFEHKESVFQNLVNKFHPKSINPLAENVKAGYDYDSFYTIQGIIVIVLAMLIILHIYYGITEAPKPLDQCAPPVPNRNREFSILNGMEPDYKVRLCPEDAKRFRDLGYSPQSLWKRFFGFHDNSYYAKEIIFGILPVISGLASGNAAIDEARRSGVKEKWRKEEFKKKAFIYGYWRAVIVLQFAFTFLDKDTIDLVINKAKQAAAMAKKYQKGLA